jgi:hypothetical protein
MKGRDQEVVAGASPTLQLELRECSAHPLVDVASPEHRRVIEVAADEHHADRQTVGHSARDAEGRVAGDVERRRVVEVAQGGGEHVGDRGVGGMGRAFIAVVGNGSTSKRSSASA